MNIDMLFDYAEKSKRDKARAHILDSIQINPETCCFEWIGPRLPSGYGRMYYDGVAQSTHRVAWVLEHGEIPKGDGYHGTCVCHKCDNPRCVNTDHMFLGTMADNMADRDRKGRGRSGPNRPSLKHK